MLIRPAQPDDALSIARVHVHAWQVGYRHLLPEDDLARLSAEERAQRYDFANRDPQRPKTLVAIHGGVVCGFATTSPARDADLSGWGELCALYVDPDCWARGLGTALLSAARQHLTGLGYRHAALWLLAGNHRADRLYRADAWVPDGHTRTECIWGTTVKEVRYRRLLQD